MCVICPPKSLILFCKCVLSLDCSSNQMDFLHTCKKYYITTFLSVYAFNLCSRSSLWWAESQFYFNHRYGVQIHTPHSESISKFIYLDLGQEMHTHVICVLLWNWVRIMQLYFHRPNVYILWISWILEF